MNNKMKAYAAVSPGKLEMVTLDIPTPDDYEVLVKNEGCMFCNTTDRMIAEELFAADGYPVLIGHEDFGTVVRVGKKVKKYKPGDRVICANASPKRYNGEYYSAWGGFAEYGIAGDNDAYIADNGPITGDQSYRARYAANSIIPSDLPFEKAAMVFPLAETASALRQCGEIEGRTVVVIGTGFVGYSFCMWAKRMGAANVVCLGRREVRLETAVKLGADKGFTDTAAASEYIRLVGGADIVIEASGNYTALSSGLPYLKPNGLLAVYAVPHKPYEIDLLKCPQNMVYRRIGPRVSEAVDYVSDVLRGGDFPIDLYITHRWSFDQVPEAYEAVVRGEVVKGLVRISDG
nr:zinc-binding dehydrogenase [Clostridia bacterium]